jgi:hypothetical protein
MWNVRGTATAMPNWLAHGATYALRIYAMRADWDGLTHSNQNVTPHSAIVTFTIPSCNQPAITTTTTTTVAPTPCAQGGTCVVGDTGPGGGIVFYVHSGGGTFACGSALTSTCRYLEAAPTSGPSAWTDARYWWSGNTNTAIGTDARGMAIGTGLKNTVAMVNQSDTANRAGTISRAYRGPNNLTDWYLPSQYELRELCKYARNQTTGDTTVECTDAGSIRSGFVELWYWSSTEIDGTDVRVADFFGVSHGPSEKGGAGSGDYVRPIRAFGGTLGCADGGTCVVGDTGPGGGIVFYVHSGGGTFACGVALASTCRYLEVAPADIAGPHAWCSNTSDLLNATYTAIGAGMENTTTADAMCSTGAIRQAADYINNGKSDWHLPSLDELNELYDQRVVVGGLAPNAYWSSSEFDGSRTWRRAFSDGSSAGDGSKADPLQVRVVRAFG